VVAAQGTASLNVTVAASIILHHFAVWAAYPERQREGAKYLVDPKPQRTTVRGQVPLSPEERAAMVQQRRGRAAAVECCDGVEGLEGGGGEGLEDAGESWVLQAGGLDALMNGLEVKHDAAAAAAGGAS
jgi:hypothetical protein